MAPVVAGWRFTGAYPAPGTIPRSTVRLRCAPPTRARHPTQERPWPAPRGPNAPRRDAAIEPSRRRADHEDRRRRDAVAARRRSRAASSPVGAADEAVPAGRMGFAEAFRASIRPMHVRADLAVLPWIAIHTKALWVPVLITVASTIAVDRDGQGGTISQFMFAYFIQTPAIGGVFIAGSWRHGRAGCSASSSGSSRRSATRILVLGFPSTIYRPRRRPRPGPRRGVSAFVLSPVIGRLLRRRRRLVSPLPRLSSPNRGRSQQGQKRGDGRPRRRPDAQKAGATPQTGATALT